MITENKLKASWFTLAFGTLSLVVSAGMLLAGLATAGDALPLTMRAVLGMMFVTSALLEVGGGLSYDHERRQLEGQQV